MDQVTTDGFMQGYGVRRWNGCFDEQQSSPLVAPTGAQVLVAVALD